MEQIQELFEILKSTPEMALWGLLIWCLYILAKLASVVWALKVVFQLAINKWHDFKIKTIALETSKTDLLNSENALKNKELHFDFKLKQIKLSEEYADIKKLAKYFNKNKISDVEMDELRLLFDAIKSTTYIHQSDIDKAVKKLKSNEKL